MPGHSAKLMGLFVVIDEIYPRQKVIDQIKAVTPETRNSYKVKSRLPSAKSRGVRDVAYQLGPQKTLL